MRGILGTVKHMIMRSRFFVQLCNMVISASICSHFFKMFPFCAAQGVKVQKMV